MVGGLGLYYVSRRRLDRTFTHSFENISDKSQTKEARTAFQLTILRMATAKNAPRS